MPKFTVKEMKATRTGFGEALVEAGCAIDVDRYAARHL